MDITTGSVASPIGPPTRLGSLHSQSPGPISSQLLPAYGEAALETDDIGERDTETSVVRVLFFKKDSEGATELDGLTRTFELSISPTAIIEEG